MISGIKTLLRQQQFQPTGLGLFVNPFYFVRRDLFRAVDVNKKLVQGNVLDVGCGTQPYRELFQVKTYVGLEYDTPDNRAKKRADLFYDGGAFPCADESFDSVVCFEVLEHVPEPERFIGEIRRVLRPGGTLLLSTPFLFEEHEMPYDFQRFTKFGLQRLLSTHGFQDIHRTEIAGGLAVMAHFVMTGVVKRTDGWKRRAPARIMQILATALVNTVVLLVSGLRCKGEIYGGNFIVARKGSIHE